MSPLLFFSIYTIFLILIFIPASHCADDERFSNCNRTYNCGNIRNVEYPFWGGDRPEYCGRSDLGLSCYLSDDGREQYSVLVTGQRIVPTYETFRVLMINQSNTSHTMRIVRKDLWNNICADQSLGNPTTTLNYSTVNYAQTVSKVNIFYGCNNRTFSNGDDVLTSNFTCQVNGTEDGGVLVTEERDSMLEGCLYKVFVPVMRIVYEELRNGLITLPEALNQGFDVDYSPYNQVACNICENSGGVCGSDSNLQFVCFCRDKSYLPECPRHGGKKPPLNWRIAISAAAGGLGAVCSFILICYWWYRHSSNKSVLFWKKKKNGDQKLEALIRQYGPLALKRYSYTGIKKMTNSLSDKLGQGGFGGVYKGSLPDGRQVAVKILSESKGNGEEFINEVASISRTSHVNVVTLLGFCLEGGKRALVYEFMPNGSLEKFIYGQKPWTSGGYLGWEKLYKIAIGIAQGLEYLHRGCNTRILHLDIKPHNILLDEEFCPKIADFGLAKLCSRKESMVSMLEARGTIGYIAPEVFSRNFGGVSSKSDVYSYGMMVLEMVGGRKNLDVGVSHGSKIYFPYWAYKRLEMNEDLGLHEIVDKDETAIARKMILVGLWCIQSDSSKRPSMKKVMEMLEGKVEDLQIPPKPFFFSPSQSLKDSSTASN